MANFTCGHNFKRMKNIIKNKYFKFFLVAVAYTLWVIWVGSFWLLIGLGVIFDMYITKKVNWTFWKKREGKNSTIVEWIDALIFAVLAVTFINTFFFQNYKIPTGSMEKSLLIGDHLYVSKLVYGPRIPNTPLSFPFVANTLPLTQGKVESYVEWIKLPYKRLAGLTHVKRYDPVVFNFPAQDTVALIETSTSYYSLIRQIAQDLQYRTGNSRSWEEYMAEAKRILYSQSPIKVRPVDKRDNYIKRCIGMPGDTLKIEQGQVLINGKNQKDIDELQFKYFINTSSSISNRKFRDIGVSIKDRDARGTGYMAVLTGKMVNEIKEMPGVSSVEPQFKEPGFYDLQVFPHDPRYPWNADNFGPLWIPRKGVTVPLTTENLPFYHQIINAYEDNELEIRDSVIYINGEKADSYTFKMDYYWMMGDSRHNSLDSRFWGFVPEDHIVGKPRFIWLSLDEERSILNGKIRFNRLFKIIR